MLSKVTLANDAGEDVVLHEDTPSSKRSLIDAQGLVGSGPLRDGKRVRPQAHGSINETSWEEGRSIHLTGEVMYPGSIENALAEFRKISGVLRETLPEGALLKWTEGVTGNKLQMLVKVDSECEPTLHDAAAFLDYAVTLFGTDPRAYSQTVTTAKGTGITGAAAEATFLKTLNKALAVCIDSGHIYWVDGVTKAIGRATVAGGTIENEWVKTEGTPISLAIDASHVYWGQAVSGAPLIGRATIAGATIENKWVKPSFFISGTAPLALAVTASFIYWSNPNIASGIGRAEIGGGSKVDPWFKVPGGEAVNALAADSTWLYLGLPDSIGRIKLGGEEVNMKWVTGTGTVTGLAVNASFVYWTSLTSRAIGRVAVGGTGANPSFIVGLASEPTGLAVNTEHLYWGESTAFIARSKELAGGGPTGSEVKVKNAGNIPTPLSFKIAGPIVNPVITCKSTGAQIALIGEVGAGNFLEIDTQARTIRLNGTDNAYGLINAQATDWEGFEGPVAPAEEAYTLTATSATAATLEVLYRSAFA